MIPGRWQEVDRIVQAALACPPEAREQLLTQHCRDDSGLRAEVDSLLSASLGAGDFLETPAVVVDRGLGAGEEPLPKQIGDYRVLRRLGAGGMGIVYLAEQQHPARRVALKVIRGGTGGVRGRERFAREAEVLGRLQHSGIAQIYEAGHATTGGVEQAYIAMEYVEGETLTDYVDQAALPISVRLRLFVQICDSVQHAHQKGVIHRDIKPGNILVQRETAVPGGPPTAKILDFGIARINDEDHVDLTLSGPQQLIGTLPYMSPEQLGGNPREVDTRADVYALGVVGFELLSGRLPHDVVGESAPAAIRRIVETAPAVLGRVDARFAGDLETILGKALESDPARRYQSAAALAEDVRRFLRHQPITARPASTLYQLRKFSRRNRGLVVGALAAVFGLVGGTAFAAWKAVEASSERDRARDAELLAETRLQAALHAQREAQEEATVAAAVTKFLRTTLASADPDAADRANATIRDALDRAAAKIGSELAGQPREESAIRLTIGETYRSLGVYPEAETHLLRALELSVENFGEHSAHGAEVLLELGGLRRDQGMHDESKRLLERCLELRLGLPEPPPEDVAAARSALAATLVRMGRHNEAVALHEQALAARRALHGDESLIVAESLATLGIAYRYLNRFEEAERNYRESLAIRRAKLRPGHPHIAVTLHNLGRVLNSQGRYQEASGLLQEAIRLIRAALPGPHPRTANFLSSYAAVLANLGQFAEAERELRDALAMQRTLFPEGHLGIAKTLTELARLPRIRTDAAEARKLLEEADDLVRRFGSADDQWAVATSLVTLFIREGTPERATALVNETIVELRERYGEQHGYVANAYMKLAEIELSAGNLDVALGHTEKSLAIRRNVLGDDHPYVTEGMHNLGYIHREAGNYERARQLLTEAVARRRAELGAGAPLAVGTAFELARTLRAMRADDDAEGVIRDCLQRYKALPGLWPPQRVLECALFLQEIATRRGTPAAFDDEIQSAIGHATERLGADHAYIATVSAAIEAAKTGGAEAKLSGHDTGP